MGRIKIFFFIYFIVQIGFSQNQSELLYNYFISIQNLEFNKNLELIKSVKNKKTKKLLTLVYQIIEDDRQTKLSILDLRYKDLDTINLNTTEKYLVNLIQGYKYLNYQKNRRKSFYHFKSAYDLGKKKKLIFLEKYSLFFLLKFYLKGSLQSNKNYKNYLEEYKLKCKTDIDWLYYYHFKFNLLSQTETYNEDKTKLKNDFITIFDKYNFLIEKSKNLNRTVLGIYYKDKANFLIRDNPELAKSYYLKALESYSNSNYFKFEKFYSFINLSRVSSLQNEHKKGLQYLNEAKKYVSYNDSLFDNYDISAFKANHFYHLKQFDSAYFYEKKVRFLGYKINFQEENQKVSEIREELKSAEKEKENLQLKQDNLEIEEKRKQNLRFLIVSILTIILGSIIGTLVLQNSKRKRKLAEQQKELEKQKNLTILKEQEITTINAMVDGQEKERKRIAEDLHDNLGSVLATLKLHFENLKINKEKKKINQEELFDKTENLIDEAYLKVRSIAHAKNAGVIANQGLLLAVQMMAEKISSADKITIEVIHFGLDKRLENALELTLFRIIQELVTNIIKHAEAKNATINISAYDKNLNLIIEDNGKGFDMNKVNLNSGMGISSIKTRVEHLEGTFTVDSTLGKGSSVIIYIPIP